jgi:hypothetical protein
MELNKSIFKWLCITNLITLLLLFATNIAWFIYESQFETVNSENIQTQTVENINSVHDITQY